MEDFNLEVAKMEYERLSKEIVSIQKEAIQLAQFAVVIAAVVCAAMVSAKVETHPYWWALKCIPCVVVLLFGFRVWAQYMRLEVIAEYIRKRYEVEERPVGAAEAKLTGKPEGAPPIAGVPGWETWLTKYLEEDQPFWSSPKWSAVIFWVALWLVTIGVIIVFSL